MSVTVTLLSGTKFTMGSYRAQLNADASVIFPDLDSQDQVMEVLSVFGLLRSNYILNVPSFNRQEVIGGHAVNVTYDPSGGRISTDVGAPPTFTSAEVGAVAATTVVVTFSANINSPSGHYETGVVIKVAGVSKTISSATRQTNHATVRYVIPAVTNGQAVTWEYDVAVGDLTNDAGADLQSVSAQTVTNTVA